MEEIRASAANEAQQATNPPSVADGVDESSPPSVAPLPLCLSHSRVEAQQTFVRSLLAQQNEHQVHVTIQDPRGLYQEVSRLLSKESRVRALQEQDAKTMAQQQQREGRSLFDSSPALSLRNNKPKITCGKDLIHFIDNVLDILDAPVP
jgi:hypothetical protein